jgi:excisionase family DNA binding protein
MSEIQLLIRKREAAKLLGDMSLSTLEKLTSRKQIPHVKIGSAVYYCPDDLRAWIAQRKIAASAC